MTRRVLAAAALTAALALTATPVYAAVVDGTSFNNPRGSRAEQYTLMHQLRDLIDGAPKGSKITGSLFNMNVTFIREALQRAHRRGVTVQLVARKPLATTPELKALVATLSKNAAGQASRVWYCDYSCGTTGKVGTQHSKDFTFTQTGGTRYVSVIMSGNVTESGAESQWNTMQVITGSCIHNPLAAYNYEMRLDRPMTRGKVITCGRYTMWLFPKVIAAHPIRTLLNATRGGKGCEVYVPMFIWRTTAEATRLAALHKSGCKVEVIIDRPTTTAAVRNILRAAGIPTWDGRNGGRFLHTKGLTIIGTVSGKATALSVGGSANLTDSAQSVRGKPSKNTDIVIVDRNRATAEAHRATFNQMKSGLSKLWGTP